LVLCDVLFTNSSCLEAQIQRLTQEKEIEYGRSPLPEPIVRTNGSAAKSLDQTTIDILVKSLTPSSYFQRWSMSMKEEVIVTHAAMGALHFQPIHRRWQNVDHATASLGNTIVITMHDQIIDDTTTSTAILISHSFCDKAVEVQVDYKVHCVGVLQHVNVVDTTGAGDAFIGGYVLAKVAQATNHVKIIDSVQFQLEIGTYVGGKKLESVGARTALPSGKAFDSDLGMDLESVRRRLTTQIGSFNRES
jgi:hypothetical protein